MTTAEIVAPLGVGGIITLIIISVVTGGVGAAIVQGLFASKRGVKGDALVKEKNALDGYHTLSEVQQALMKDLVSRLEKAETNISNMDTHIDELTKSLTHEIQYQNLLIWTLHENTIEVPARPERK